jgi:primase-polymerase (primpol)-like protein
MLPELDKRKKAALTDMTRKPDAISVVPDGIPAELASLAQFVGWDYRPNRKGDKWAKVPIHPRTGHVADATDPTNWGTLDEALNRYQRNNLAGIGFSFKVGGGLVGIDCDACRWPETGQVDPLARTILDKFAGYAEVSPSGLGIKLWVRGKWSHPDNQVAAFGLEVYAASRFFAITGVPA